MRTRFCAACVAALATACGASAPATTTTTTTPAPASTAPDAETRPAPERASPAAETPPTPAHASEHAHVHGQAPLVHRFEHARDWAAEFDDPARDAWQQPERVIDVLALAPGMTVADVGAGTGYFEARLSRAVGEHGRVLALDIEPDMVRYLTARAEREGLNNVEPKLVATDDAQLQPASVDRILIVDTWHHIPAREAYAKKLRSALKPGGAVYIVDFKPDAHHGPPPEHRLPPDQIVRELTAGGLSAHIKDASLPEQYIVIGTRQ